MSKYEALAKQKIIEHKAEVARNIDIFIAKLSERAVVHDDSKLGQMELPYLTRLEEALEERRTKGLRMPIYGGSEYKTVISILEPMRQHHNSVNSHHPEFYPDGMAGMCLADITEMLSDWRAAAVRDKTNTIQLTYSAKRHKIDPMLVKILQNTADRLGWGWV